MWARSLAVLPLGSWAPSCLQSAESYRLSERGRGNWALSPIMQRDSPAHSPGGNCQVPKRSERGQSHAQGFSVSVCATFVTGPPAQSNHLAMPDSRVERQASLLSEKESVAIFWPFTQMTKSRVIQLWEAKPSFRQRWAQEALLWEPHPLSPRRLAWPHSEARVRGHVSGSGNSGAAAAGTTRGKRSTDPGRSRESVGEMAHSPNTRTCILFTPLLHPLLSLPLLLHVRTWSIYHKACRPVEGGGLCVAPALAQDSGVCSRERKRSLRSQNGKGIHLDSFSNRYTLHSLPSCSGHSRTVLRNSKLKSFL